MGRGSTARVVIGLGDAAAAAAAAAASVKPNCGG